MRPIKLVMTGFGTYLKSTVVDFDKLGKSGLYIVTGDTGSGKTTIFDAVSYALYGEPSGDMRQTSMLRTIFATPETPTKVELTFEYRDKIYKIERNPAYPRPDKRNPDKVVMESASATLYKPGEPPLTNGKGVNINEEIKAILGIDQNQFRQIVMIAQGEFQRLIKQDTTARIETFRQLFGTEKYDQLQNKLGEESKSLRETVKTTSASLNQYMNQVRCHEDNILNIDLEKAKKTDIPWKEKLEVVEKIIKEDEVISGEKINSREKVQNQIGELNVQIGAAEKSVQAQKDLEVKKQEIQNKKLQLDELSKNLEKEKNRQQERGEKEGELAVFKDKLSSYDELDKTQNSVKNLESSINQNKRLLEESQVNKTETENQINAKKEELKKFDKVMELLVSLENQQEKVIQNENELEKLIKDSQLSKNHYEQLLKAQKEFLDAQKQAHIVKTDYEEKNRLYLMNQAGILAENLQENEECPVCGSIHHPKLAEKSNEAPSKEELEVLKQKAEKAALAESEKSVEAGSKKGAFTKECSTLQIAIKESLKEDFALEEDFQNQIEVVQNKLVGKSNEINKELQLLKTKIDEQKKNKLLKEKLDKDIPMLEEKDSKLQESINKLSIDISGQEATVTSLSKQITDLQKNLEFKTKQEAQNKINDLEKELFQIKAAYDKAEKDFNLCNEGVKALEGQILTLENTVKDLKDFDMEKALKNRAELQQNLDELNTELETFASRLDINKQMYSLISESSVELIKTQERESFVTELYNTSVGKLGNKTAKIKLETYIQMTYFDRIIAFANKRFLIMTDKQYEMVRDETENAQNQGGLEINVIDHYNGGQRSIKSLSGGEQFQASLALALGLSDEIAQSAGGIKIDTLFVDEGFGTLDDETARKAYKALTSIAENNRLVGLISHIDLLKSQIDKQLIVTKKQNEGSFVEIKV